jgi:hypothetical protein
MAIALGTPLNPLKNGDGGRYVVHGTKQTTGRTQTLDRGDEITGTLPLMMARKPPLESGRSLLVASPHCGHLSTRRSRGGVTARGERIGRAVALFKVMKRRPSKSYAAKTLQAC